MPGNRNNRNFDSVQIAPLYDAVTTVVFPGLKHDRMAMKLNGKNDSLKLNDFLRTAETLRNQRISCTVRQSKGRNILAACGQLASAS